MVTIGFFVVLPLMWQLPICFITAELTTTFQVGVRTSIHPFDTVHTCLAGAPLLLCTAMSSLAEDVCSDKNAQIG